MRVRDGYISGYREVQKKRCRGSRAVHLRKKTLRSPPRPVKLLLVRVLRHTTLELPSNPPFPLPTARSAFNVARPVFALVCTSPTCIRCPGLERRKDQDHHSGYPIIRAAPRTLTFKLVETIAATLSCSFTSSFRSSCLLQLFGRTFLLVPSITRLHPHCPHALHASTKNSRTAALFSESTSFRFRALSPVASFPSLDGIGTQSFAALYHISPRQNGAERKH